MSPEDEGEDDEVFCQSKGKNHGHCLICWFKGCECYPLDLWACIEESIGRIVVEVRA